ncbi:DNA polymerase III subunit delta [Henriciella sp.]|uniref:DNA polymerase III subunit delta n=1 Tax=Henriciella sp. TaxID=1968823 RepID=UPI00263A1AC3|nr:DNA polymerase III subunit delta [Henriciella sp.]
MIIKPAALSGHLRKPDPALWCMLVFGDDDGVVSDTADSIAKAWSASAAGGAKVLTLNDDDIRREPHLLNERIETGSLLGETDIIRVRTSGEKISKAILGLVEQADQSQSPFQNRLLILCSGLNKRSKLRAGLESARLSAAIHVFADSDHSVRELIQARLDTDGIAIDLDALDRFAANLPGHRGLANQETDKLALFGRGLGRPISLDDVNRLSLTDADTSLRDMIHAALDGDREACLNEYHRVSESGTSAISILRLLELEVKRLLQARGLAGTSGNIGMKLRPPVWQSEWPAFRSRMDRWSAPALNRLLAAVHDHEIRAKEAGNAADASVRVLLLNVLKSASGRPRTRGAQ